MDRCHIPPEDRLAAPGRWGGCLDRDPFLGAEPVPRRGADIPHEKRAALHTGVPPTEQASDLSGSGFPLVFLSEEIPAFEFDPG